jgi:hypothetical protein
VQTVEKFFPHLIQDDRTREAALDAIAVLGEQQLAMTLAEIFGGRSGAAILAKLANSPDSSLAAQAARALAAQFNHLRATLAIVWNRSVGKPSAALFVSQDGLLIAPSFVFENSNEASVRVQLPPGDQLNPVEVLYRSDDVGLAIGKVRLDRPVLAVQGLNTDPQYGEQAIVVGFADVGGSKWISRSGRLYGTRLLFERRVATDIAWDGLMGVSVVDTSGRLLGIVGSLDSSGKSVVVPADAIRDVAARAGNAR